MFGAEKVAAWFGAPEEEVRIVHGLAVGTGGEVEGQQYGHAWVECRGLAFDFSRSMDDPVIASIDRYREIGQIDPEWIASYPLAEARCKVVEHQHYGPWEDWLRLTWTPASASSPKKGTSLDIPGRG